ncbi:hypothetical protein AX016_1236 [Cellulophaga sp. RHA19]|uniref:hypothetical protein n=1 Tax=Cellulophaga sp. RHA19 TaxID=1798237 RepID=UPI000C2CBE92|nr:hypothetical protein [Cellulophaga sp. RHA19]PKB43053.1 hypothetical protein AX016_1236 [Cellulophaga sp. RHA19]
MFEFLRNLITIPLWTFLGVLIVWIIFRFLLVKISNLTAVTWTRLEYIWIGIGLLGVLTLVDENRKQFNKSELEKVEIWIKNDSKSLLNFTNNQMHCFQYNNTGLFSQEEFDRKQSHSDSICCWVKKVGLVVKESTEKGYTKIENTPELLVSEKEKEFAFKEIERSLIEINKNIERRDVLITETNDNFWKGFKYSFGLLLLIIAFGIRLTIISKKVKDVKNKA